MKVAVVSIGINYQGQQGELQGCVNDSHNFVAWARNYYGGSLAQVVQMTDDLPKRHKWYPTKDNIIRVLSNMRKRCKKNNFTNFVLHYSGHGGQVVDVNGDEADGFDEVLIPVDYMQSGFIGDDWLLANFIERIHSSIRFFGLIDACHSGTILDLRYCNNILANKQASEVPNAMMVSGASDDQVAYDTWDATYGRCGAMTASFLRTAEDVGMSAPAQSFVETMQTDLADRGYPQVPKLSTSKPIAPSDTLFLA